MDDNNLVLKIHREKIIDWYFREREGAIEDDIYHELKRTGEFHWKVEDLIREITEHFSFEILFEHGDFFLNKEMIPNEVLELPTSQIQWLSPRRGAKEDILLVTLVW